jgi:transketolase
MNSFPIETKHEASSKSHKLDARSIELRVTIVKMLESSRRGHLASALSLVEILRVLYDDVMQYDPDRPNWSHRDRFILSKGHGCLALYAILAEKGFFPQSELWKFCQKDGMLGGHPEIKTPGVEASTGSLGHGLSIGIGFALNAIYSKAGHQIFVLVGDGETNEGAIWEAAMCAGKHRLENLTVIVDYNKNQSSGSTFEVQDLEPFADKWRCFGFGVTEVDGHNVDDLKAVFSKVPIHNNKPSVVICHTIKGKGIKHLENNLNWHHKSKISDKELKMLYESLGA